jgi:ureidoacrylate peracid hydrolase
MKDTQQVLLDLPARLAPEHSALLVIDMQNDFCAPGGWTDTVVHRDVSACAAVAPSIAALVDFARRAAVPVVWVRADYTTDRVVEPMRARTLALGAPACCVPGTWGAAWFGGLAPAADEAVFTKRCYSGFAGTGLDQHLRDAGIRTIVFAGVQTHVCVESTLRDAHSRGFYCVLAADAVASHTAPAHEQTLASVRFLFGDVAPVSAIAAAFARRDGH